MVGGFGGFGGFGAFGDLGAGEGIWIWGLAVCGFAGLGFKFVWGQGKKKACRLPITP